VAAYLKVAMFVGDAVFAGSLLLVRTSTGGFSWQALSVSMLEFSIALFNTTAGLLVADVLRANGWKSGPFKVARAELKAANKVLKKTERQLGEAEAKLVDAEDKVARRENGVRRGPMNRALAASTVAVAHDVTVSKLIAKAAATPAEDAIAGEVDKHLLAEFSHEQKRRTGNVR
jgi:hypothetical protein